MHLNNYHSMTVYDYQLKDIDYLC